MFGGGAWSMAWWDLMLGGMAMLGRSRWIVVRSMDAVGESDWTCMSSESDSDRRNGWLRLDLVKDVWEVLKRGLDGENIVEFV